MKIVHHVKPRCNCQAKLRELAQAMHIDGDSLEVGSIVECDCGQQYKLTDHQFDGPTWQWYHPDSGDMSKR